MIKFKQLAPTQQAALADCVRSTLRRCRGGYRTGENAHVHTIRCVYALNRAGLIELSEDLRAATATADGYRVGGNAPLECTA